MDDQDKPNPGLLYEISGNYWKSCTLHAAVKLDLFTAIGEEALTAADVADRARCSETGVERLLHALVALGLLARDGERYRNTRESASFLSKTSPQYAGYMILHHHYLVEPWGRLDEAVRTGQPVQGRASEDREKYRESFLMGMFNLAVGIAPRLASVVDLSGRRRLLDLGGGPGTYAIHFCLQNPDLKATVYDLPTTRPFAEQTIRRFGVEDRVDFAAGNYLEDPIPGSFDVVWMSQVLHGEGPGGCRTMIEKAVSSLEPGGTILVHEFLLDDTMDGPLFPTLFSLNMLLGTPDGQAYSEGQIRDMMAGAGVKEIRRLTFQGPNDSGILAGVA